MKLKLGDYTVGYEESGDGVVLILLHGFPHDRRLWDPVRRGVAGTARCITPDLRGFGESSAGECRASMDQYADDLAAFMDALGIEQAVVGGISMGGYVTMAFWRRHRERVRALMFSDTRADADSAETRSRRDLHIELAAREGARAISKLLLPSLVSQQTMEGRPDITNALEIMMAGQPVSVIISALKAMRDRQDSRASLAGIDVPTLVLVGESDKLSPPNEARALVEAIPATTSTRLEIIAGAAHLPCLERPAPVVFVLSEFLSSLNP